MTDKLKDLLDVFKTVSPLIAGFVSAYFGSLFALRKFKKEKKWDDRKSAEREIICACEELLNWAEQVRAETYCEPASQIDANNEDAFRTINRFANIGESLFRNDFYNLIINLNDQLETTKFQIHNESLGDLETQQRKCEWYSIKASELRKIIEDNLPNLKKIAKSKRFK